MNDRTIKKLKMFSIQKDNVVKNKEFILNLKKYKKDQQNYE